MWNFALAEAEQERLEEAFVLFRQALAECGACPARGQIHKNFGLVYGHSGDYQSAELQRQKAAELMPDDTEVREALAIVRSGGELSVPTCLRRQLDRCGQTAARLTGALVEGGQFGERDGGPDGCSPRIRRHSNGPGPGMIDGRKPDRCAGL